MFVLRICVVKNVAERKRQPWELSGAVPVCYRENLHYWNRSKGKRGGLGPLEGGSNRNDCWVCGFEAAGWVQVPWEELGTDRPLGRVCLDGACSLSACPHSSRAVFPAHHNHFHPS